MSFVPRASLLALVVALASLEGALPAVGADWLPVTPGDLQLKSEPKAAGAPAIYLYREISRNDEQDWVSVYERIKILSAEGRDRGDVRITYGKGQRIGRVAARTVALP